MADMRTSGDIVNIAAGADDVMVGSLLAARTRLSRRGFFIRAAPYKSYGAWAVSEPWREAPPTGISQGTSRTAQAAAEGVEGVGRLQGASVSGASLVGGLRGREWEQRQADIEAQ